MEKILEKIYNDYESGKISMKEMNIEAKKHGLSLIIFKKYLGLFYLSAKDENNNIIEITNKSLKNG